VEDDKIVEKGVGVVLPSEDDEQVAEGVHGVTVPGGGRPSSGFHLLPGKRLDVLQVDSPDIIKVFP
jgi:hypothetical protein